jgi:hypothetical protein
MSDDSPIGDGYYFTVASRTTVDPNSGIGSAEGFDSVLWYKIYKPGGNDGEAPDANVQMAPIYPLGGAPPQNNPATIDDGSGNGCEQPFFSCCDLIYPPLFEKLF